jgi:hypothetical protein
MAGTMARQPPIVVWRDPADELRPDNRVGAIDVTLPREPARAQSGHPSAAAGPGRRAIDLAGTDDHGARTLKFISLARERPGELTEGDVVPAAGLRMRETKLLIGGSDNADARLREVARFIRTNREAERRRVDNDETVAP